MIKEDMQLKNISAELADNTKTLDKELSKVLNDNLTKNLQHFKIKDSMAMTRYASLLFTQKLVLKTLINSIDVCLKDIGIKDIGDEFIKDFEKQVMRKK